MPSTPTNTLDRVPSRGRPLGLLLAVALCVSGFGGGVNISLAEGTPAPAPQVAGKVVVLPKFEVNGLRERIDARAKIMAKKPWGDFMCLDNGVLIDNTLFASKYMAAHPKEIVRLVGLQVGLEGRHDGVGDMADGNNLDCFLVYTSGDELHARDVRYGDRVYPDFKARQIRTLSDDKLLRNTIEFLETTHGYAPNDVVDVLRYERSIDDHAVPVAVSGDDPNLQVRYAEAKLKEVGMTTFVVPATERTSPNNDLMLIFGTGHEFFVWRPFYGAFHLSKAAYAKFGIGGIAEVTTR